MADDDKHENPVDVMLHEMQSLAGYKSYVITNNQGIVLKYDNVEYDEAVQTVTQVLDLMQKSKLVLKTVLKKDAVNANGEKITIPMDSAESDVENLRLKSDEYEMIVSQQGNYTMIVNQSFKVIPVDEEEGGEAPAAAEH